MKASKLKNYDQMIAAYQTECRAFWFKEFPVIAIIGVTIIFGGLYALTLGSNSPDGLPWWALATLVWIPPMVVLAKMLLPVKPRPADVLLNRRLRWQHGMDTSVSSGDDDL